MTANEFVIWLKGFAVACNDFHPTPAQWEIIKEELDKVGKLGSITFSSSTGNISTSNLANRTDITYTTKHQLND